MFMKKSLLVFALAAVLVPHVVGAAEIVGFRFEGLRKTKEAGIVPHLEKFIGKEDSDDTLHQIETALQAQELFSEIKVAREESEKGTTVAVTVKEKITFMVLPLFMISKGQLMGGAFLLNTNAFGLGHSIAAGGYLSKTEYRGIFSYSKPAAGRAPGISFFSTAGKSEKTFTDINDNEYLSYDTVSVNGGLSLTEKIGDYLTLSLTERICYKDNDFYKDGIVEDALVFETRPGYRLAVSDWNGTFLSTKSLEQTYTFATGKKVDPWHMLVGRICLQQPVLQDLRVNVQAIGFHTVDAPMSEWAGNGNLGVKLYPSDFNTPSGAGINTMVEYAAFKTKAGVFSLYGTYQGAFAKDVDEEVNFDQGLGMGMQMYLKQLAVPAMNFGMIYNLTRNTFGMSFSIGMGF